MQGKPPTKRRVIPDSVDSDAGDAIVQKERYEVDGFLDEKIVDGKRFLLVRWVGYALPTWEPVENADECDQKLREFNVDMDPGYDDEEHGSDEEPSPDDDPGFDENF